jgi:iron complex outermembrane receptor protein
MAVKQNLYAPLALPLSALVPHHVRLTAGSVNIDTGLYAMDRAHIGEKLLVIVRHVDYRTRTNSAVSPCAPGPHRRTRAAPKTSLYFSYIEGWKAARAGWHDQCGSVLPAVRSRQWNWRARAEAGDFRSAGSASTAALPIPTWPPTPMSSTAAPCTRGIEASVQGTIVPSLSVALAGQYLVARQRQTGGRARRQAGGQCAALVSSAFVNWQPVGALPLGAERRRLLHRQALTDVLNQGVLLPMPRSALAPAIALPWRRAAR